MVRIDRSQLHQIVWNLVENGLRYSRGKPLLRIECGIFPGSERPYLDIKDSGPGMTSEIAEHVFEPFFTSEPAGTGLGLYIARELAESNQAALSLVEHGELGARFRLTFAHPERRQVVV
jgi:two-component system sensor histidine kinase PilS (NtrC family)